MVEEVREAYLVRLGKILNNHFSESEFKALCGELGVNLEDLEAPDLSGTNKFRRLPHLLLRMNRLEELVDAGNRHKPHLSWDAEDGYRYYVATGLARTELDERFEIPDVRYEETDNYDEAHILIFDLDNPPLDWLRYLRFIESDRLKPVIFVAYQESLGEGGSRTPQVQGKMIYDMIPSPYRDDLLLCKTPEQFNFILKTLSITLKVAKTSRRAAIRQAQVE